MKRRIKYRQFAQAVIKFIRSQPNNPYWDHLFSRYKFRSKLITWCLNKNDGWVRIYRWVIRWNETNL